MLNEFIFVARQGLARQGLARQGSFPVLLKTGFKDKQQS